MVVVAVRDDAGFGLAELQDRLGFGCELCQPEPMRTGESADELARFGAKSPQLEIAEPGVERGIGVQADPAGFEHRVGLGRGGAGQAEARRGLRIRADRDAHDHHGAAWLAPQMARVRR